MLTICSMKIVSASPSIAVVREQMFASIKGHGIKEITEPVELIGLAKLNKEAWACLVSYTRIPPQPTYRGAGTYPRKPCQSQGRLFPAYFSRQSSSGQTPAGLYSSPGQPKFWHFSEIVLQFLAA